MNSTSALVNIILIFVLVFLNGFFVAAEFGLVKVRSSRIDELVTQGHKRARMAKGVIAHLHTYLSVCQLGITLTSLGLGWIGEPTVAHLLEGPLTRVGLGDAVDTISYIVSFVVITYVHIVLGEMTPKSLAIHRSDAVVLNAAPVLSVLSKLMYPFIWVFNGSANAFLRFSGMNVTEEDGEAYTEHELRILMNESHKSGLIDSTEMALLDNIFEYSDRIAREIMIPRVDIIAISADASEQEIMRLITEHEHTRYPVADGDKDHIIGYIHVKDMYVRESGRNVMDCIRPMIKVPETTEIHDVLRDMQKSRTQIAIVVDEYGGTAGLVTMEDIIEELVGEIQDEFDDELAPVVKLGQEYSVDGRLLMDEVVDLLGLAFHPIDVDTVGGFVISRLRKIPEQGDSVVQGEFTFTVERAEQGRVTRVRISGPNPS
ncbi:hemolysin family protein [Alicyclobacillus fastidiosus]|uniref:Hemolysin family protein n=1 Tax=Alicyclobacillus fastidiosus TaxID=392011 RepID=A0ABY6ZK80_9BACL|nr:hemolysin family protein [Alicyclobacillus fastidiosus]WAH43008.1 hemolysin family protein [Alicyclobacillus fastidiosus]GMA64978.1 membrane protein [Alicyclobacillus fastidiosus]